MADVKGQYGNSDIKKTFAFSREKDYPETITIRMEIDSDMTSEQMQRMSEIVQEALDKTKKVVEEW